MVTNFVLKAATQTKKKGPHRRAQLFISKAVLQSSSLKLCKAIGRRTGSKWKQQKQDGHVVNREGPDVIGKSLYYNWETETAQQVKESFNVNNWDVVNVDYFVP